jgi:hypothetical protein
MKRRPARGIARVRALACVAGLMAAAPASAHASTASGIFGPSVATMASRNDMHDLSPLPRNPNDYYPENQASHEGIFSPDASIDPTGAAGASTRTSPTHVSTRSAGKSELRQALDKMDLYYTGNFSGPSLGSDPSRTWNAFGRSQDTPYVYHTLDFNYHFDRQNLVGFEVAAKHDMREYTQPSPPGYIPNNPDPIWSWQDPQFWYKRSSILDMRYFWTDTMLSIFPGMTDYSANTMGKIASFAWDTTWNMKLRDYRWTLYFTSRVMPTVYSDRVQGADDFAMRDWMYLSAGYYLGYRLAPSWQINTTAVFDCGVQSTLDQDFYHTDAYDDRVGFELNYYVGRLARIGTYVQTIVTDPTLDKTIVGLDVTVNIL